MRNHLETIAALKKQQPNNIAIQCFDPDYYQSLSEVHRARLLRCLNSGIENPDSEMGCYANLPTDYDDLQPFFCKVLAQYHGVSEDARQLNNWNLLDVDGVPDDGALDFKQLDIPALSMRIRVGRNLSDFPLPAAMNKQERIELEDRMVQAFEKLIENPEYGGAYHSLTPGHSNEVDDATYQKLVAEHIMFKDMKNDRYLAAAGIASDWPHGRGCYVSADRSSIVWVGEEDHLRIMCMENGSVLSTVFDRLTALLDMVEGTDGLTFAKSKTYGYVTSCPTNLGTGMRASVHIQLPNLMSSSSETQLKNIAKLHGLGVRGVGGEHTSFGDDGTVDVSPKARFCITEAEIIAELYQGIAALKTEEDKLGEVR